MHLSTYRGEQRQAIASSEVVKGPGSRHRSAPVRTPPRAAPGRGPAETSRAIGGPQDRPELRRGAGQRGRDGLQLLSGGRGSDRPRGHGRGDPRADGSAFKVLHEPRGAAHLVLPLLATARAAESRVTTPS